jgi:hypothetical protein
MVNISNKDYLFIMNNIEDGRYSGVSNIPAINIKFINDQEDLFVPSLYEFNVTLN